MVAEYADLWNSNSSFSDIPHKIEVLAEHCEAVGRDLSEINKTPLGTLVIGDTMEDAVAKRNEFLAARGIDWDQLPDDVRAMVSARLVVGDADAVGEQVRDLLALGLDGVVFNMPADGWDVEAVSRAGEVLRKATA
jgi:alkanesulfonate monooxygenase SsuD/methylene tetrahydromethanopterin reductase-like flavin-dependent oxidoreductase (luciferase family)